jgi:hypothetical protein
VVRNERGKEDEGTRKNGRRRGRSISKDRTFHYNNRSTSTGNVDLIGWKGQCCGRTVESVAEGNKVNT